MSSTTSLPNPPHPVVWFAERAHAVLDDALAGGLHVATLSSEQTARTVVALARLEARVAALKASLLPHADTIDLAADATPVATSTGAWLAHATTTPGGQCHKQVKVAKRLQTDYDVTRDAALAGQVDPAQAEVIVTALDNLPDWVSAEQRVRAEAHLVGLAREHDAKALKLLARHLLHVIDPDAADDELARRLEKEETDAARRTVLEIFDDGNGSCHGTFRIPAVHGAMLTVALEALASPKRPDAIDRTERVDADDPDGGVRRRSAPELLGEAFVELIERYPTKKLPRTGGGLATVLVTIPLEVLEGRLGVATLSTGGQITAGAARRLACHHGLISQVLGAKSEVLDQGRRRRLHTEPQRIAMATRDKGCTAEGCTIPSAWCHAHHDTPWSRQGQTSVKDGRLLCPRHHTLIHRPGYHHTKLPDGRVRITKQLGVRRQ